VALLDRAIVDADVLVLHDASLVDAVSGAAVSLTGSPVQVDPIVSGSDFAYLFDGAAASKSMSIPIPSLYTYDSVCLEFYLYMAGSAGFTVAKAGADNLIEFVSTGLANITLPYTTLKVVPVEFTPDDTTQISISMTRSNYSIWVDAVLVASGDVANLDFKPHTTVSMTSPAAGTLVFGAFGLYRSFQTDPLVQSRQVEAVFGTPDASARYDFVDYDISDFSQDYAVKYDIPKALPWSEFLVSGLAVENGALGLDLGVVEEYDTATNSYFTVGASGFWGANAGIANVQIPSYTTSATNRGIVHLRSARPGLDQFALRFNTGNRLDLLRTVFSVDANFIDTSSVTVTQQATPATAIGNATAVNVGFGWNPNGLYVVYGSTAMLVAGTAGINFRDYEVTFGNTRSTANGAFDQPYYTSQANWTWQLRLWDSFDDAAPTVSSTSWGAHTFFTSEYASASRPVRAEKAINFDVALREGLTIRQPYFYIDAEISGITEVLQ
jgi:hypothetical protein